MKALLIPTHGAIRGIELEEDEGGSTLRALQRTVGGRVEAFSPLFGDEPTLYVNEEGVFAYEPNRAVVATAEMERAGFLSQLDGHPVREGELYGILFGDIVALGFDPETGESRDIAPDEAQRVRSYFSARGTDEGSGFAATMAVAAGRRR